MIIETDRLYLRELTQNDYSDICKMLQDKDVMYAYEHAFDDIETHNWLDRQIARYSEYGFGLWAVIRKSDEEFIGQCGITIQDCNGKQVLEIGYLLCKNYWHCGYATEAAIACKHFAFENLNADEVYSIIRDNNYPSQKVALRNGMRLVGKFDKFYYNTIMPHLIFKIKNPKLKI